MEGSSVCVTAFAFEFPVTCEQAEHCLMVLDKAPVKMTLVGNFFKETEMIVLGIRAVIFHFLVSLLLSPCLYHGDV